MPQMDRMHGDQIDWMHTAPRAGRRCRCHDDDGPWIEPKWTPTNRGGERDRSGERRGVGALGAAEFPRHGGQLDRQFPGKIIIPLGF